MHRTVVSSTRRKGKREWPRRIDFGIPAPQPERRRSLMNQRSTATALLLLLLLLGAWLAPPVAAVPLTVYLSNGITTATCADVAACDASPLAGVVSFTSVLGTTTLSLTGVGSGSPALPGLMMDLAYSVTQSMSGPGGTVTIQASETDQAALAALFS